MAQPARVVMSAYAKKNLQGTSYKWKGKSSWLNQERKKVYAEIAKTNCKNKSSEICEMWGKNFQLILLLPPKYFIASVHGKCSN